MGSNFRGKSEKALKINLELALETRLTKLMDIFFEHLVLACTIELMDDLGLVRWIIC